MLTSTQLLQKLKEAQKEHAFDAETLALLLGEIYEEAGKLTGTAYLSESGKELADLYHELAIQPSIKPHLKEISIRQFISYGSSF